MAISGRTDTWTLLRHTDDRLAIIAATVPGRGSSIAVDEWTITIGDPTNNRVMVFSRGITASKALQFVQNHSGPMTTAGALGPHSPVAMGRSS
ncbi:MAG: hypothetical protein R2706_08840 [Acidimicrobiales bacterium]